MIPKSVGMDLTEVNFSLTEGATRMQDEQTFKDLFEFICHQVNQPSLDKHLVDTISRERTLFERI
jgi:hypothetical protein